jgi:hypothetical protein
MSAFPPIVTELRTSPEVRSVPIAEVVTRNDALVVASLFGIFDSLVAPVFALVARIAGMGSISRSASGMEHTQLGRE